MFCMRMFYSSIDTTAKRDGNDGAERKSPDRRRKVVGKFIVPTIIIGFGLPTFSSTGRLECRGRTRGFFFFHSVKSICVDIEK